MKPSLSRALRAMAVSALSTALLLPACRKEGHVLPPEEKVTDEYCAKQMGPDDGCGACLAQCGYCYAAAAPAEGKCLAPGGPAGSNERPTSCGAASEWAGTPDECPAPPPGPPKDAEW